MTLAEFVPDPEHIKAECARIQAEWSPMTRIERGRGMSDERLDLRTRPHWGVSKPRRPRRGPSALPESEVRA